MISLHERLAFIVDLTNRLTAQRCELEQLRSQVRKAELGFLRSSAVSGEQGRYCISERHLTGSSALPTVVSSLSPLRQS